MVFNPGTMNAIDRALQKTQMKPAELAGCIGESQQTLHNWRKRNRVPADKVLKLASVTGLRPHEIRPDIFPCDEVAA